MPKVSDAPIFGTGGSDYITVESSISFQWVPAPGNSYSGSFGWFDWDTWSWMSSTTTGPSSASGYVTFTGATSSEPFQTSPLALSFTFSDGDVVGWSQPYFPDPWSAKWAYDPTTGVLNPQGWGTSWDDWMGAFFTVNGAGFDAYHWDFSSSDAEQGHWQLVPQIHNVAILGGGGDDTILGGQGDETLDGGSGNDLIRASVGNDLLRGGAGNDELHGGIGTQTLMGGTGNDIIWGGTGTQMLLGDDGSDIIHGGSGTQALTGGAGNDTLWGGQGLQFLAGGNGSDVLHAGDGNEILSGGAGRDSFEFSDTVSGLDVITDFRAGQDIIKIASECGGLLLAHPADLLPLLSANPIGDAVLTFGGDFRLVLQNVTAQRVEAHPADFFRIT